MEGPDLGGLWVPIITPLGSDGHVDSQALRRLAGRLLADGCAGLVALGTTGEPATLESHERALVIDTCAAACADAGKPLMVGVGSNCTRSTIAALLEVEAAAQPSVFLVVVPYYTRPSEDAIVDHYRAVADASATPVVVYNVPYRTGRALGADALLELARTPAIVGLKQAVGSLDLDTLQILRSRPKHFQVLAGDDAFIAPTILMGGVGAIAASAHVATPAFVAMVQARKPVASATPPPWHASCSRSSPPGSHTPIPRHGKQRFTCSARSVRRRYGRPCRRQRVQRLPNSWQRSPRSPSARDRRRSPQLAAGARSISVTSATEPAYQATSG